MKIKPAASRRKIVVFDEIDIFLNDSVGILLTNKSAIRIVKKGVNCFTSKLKLKSVQSLRMNP